MTVQQNGDRRPRPTRHRGPVMLRGGEPDPRDVGTTTDQRLLDRRGCTDWVHTDPGRSVTFTPLTFAGQTAAAQEDRPEMQKVPALRESEDGDLRRR